MGVVSMSVARLRPTDEKDDFAESDGDEIQGRGLLFSPRSSA